MKAISDNRRGVDLLETLPFVQPEGFAAIGHSLGGHNAIFTAVWDERIKVVVSSCGFDRFVDYKEGTSVDGPVGVTCLASSIIPSMHCPLTSTS